MSTCFVIQPFDGAKFDKRYEDVYKPAIEHAGLEAYRVDVDPHVSFPIESIKKKEFVRQLFVWLIFQWTTLMFGTNLDSRLQQNGRLLWFAPKSGVEGIPLIFSTVASSLIKKSQRVILNC